MNSGQPLIAKLAVVMVMVVTMVKTETCFGGRGTSFLSLEMTSWRNASGHRHVKTDIMFPRVRNGSKQADFDVKHYTSFETSVVRALSMVSVPETVRGPPQYELVAALGWYRLHQQPLTWEEARVACEGEGAHLAVLNSEREAQALRTLFARAPEKIANARYSHIAHVGYSDVTSEGDYRTIFGETLEEAGYAAWDDDQPNNVPNELDKESDCGGFQKDGKLNDIQCRAPCPYFCEYPL